jgi:hypothetical protein
VPAPAAEPQPTSPLRCRLNPIKLPSRKPHDSTPFKDNKGDDSSLGVTAEPAIGSVQQLDQIPRDARLEDSARTSSAGQASVPVHLFADAIPQTNNSQSVRFRSEAGGTCAMKCTGNEKHAIHRDPSHLEQVRQVTGKNASLAHPKVPAVAAEPLSSVQCDSDFCTWKCTMDSVPAGALVNRNCDVAARDSNAAPVVKVNTNILEGSGFYSYKVNHGGGVCTANCCQQMAYPTVLGEMHAPLDKHASMLSFEPAVSGPTMDLLDHECNTADLLDYQLLDPLTCEPVCMLLPSMDSHEMPCTLPLDGSRIHLEPNCSASLEVNIVNGSSAPQPTITQASVHNSEARHGHMPPIFLLDKGLGSSPGPLVNTAPYPAVPSAGLHYNILDSGPPVRMFGEPESHNRAAPNNALRHYAQNHGKLANWSCFEQMDGACSTDADSTGWLRINNVHDLDETCTNLLAVTDPSAWGSDMTSLNSALPGISWQPRTALSDPQSMPNVQLSRGQAPSGLAAQLCTGKPPRAKKPMSKVANSAKATKTVHAEKAQACVSADMDNNSSAALAVRVLAEATWPSACKLLKNRGRKTVTTNPRKSGTRGTSRVPNPLPVALHHTVDETECAAECSTTKPAVAAVPPMSDQAEAACLAVPVVVPVVCTAQSDFLCEEDTQDHQRDSICTSASPSGKPPEFGIKSACATSMDPNGVEAEPNTATANPAEKADAHIGHWCVAQAEHSKLDPLSCEGCSNLTCSKQCPYSGNTMPFLDASDPSTPLHSPPLHLDSISASRPSLATRDLTVDFARLPKIEAPALQLEVPEAPRADTEFQPKALYRHVGEKAKAADLCGAPQGLKSPRLDSRMQPSKSTVVNAMRTSAEGDEVLCWPALCDSDNLGRQDHVGA